MSGGTGFRIKYSSQSFKISAFIPDRVVGKNQFFRSVPEAVMITISLCKTVDVLLLFLFGPKVYELVFRVEELLLLTFQ